MNRRVKSCAHPFCLMHPGANGYCSRCPTDPPVDPLEVIEFLKRLNVFVTKFTESSEVLVTNDLLTTLRALSLQEKDTGIRPLVTVAQIKHLLPTVGYTFDLYSLPHPYKPVDILIYYFVLDWWNMGKYKDIHSSFPCYWGAIREPKKLYERRAVLLQHMNSAVGNVPRVRTAYERVLSLYK